MMPHAQVVLAAQMTARHMRLTEADVFYCFTPLYHMSPKFMCVLGAMLAGAEVVLDAEFDPARWLERVRECGATASGGPGALIEMVHGAPASPRDREHRLRVIFGAPVPRHIARAFRERFGVNTVELWGMTEIGLPCWTGYDEPLREGSCGKVREDWYEMRVVDPETDLPRAPGETGEFVVRPKAPWIVAKGYMGMPDKTVEAWRNLWFHTGDLGYVDVDGNVYFVERASERIRRRSENISAYEIEVAALEHPQILDAAAVGVPSDYLDDDDVKLCLVRRPGAEPAPLAILEHLAARLPHHMVPRYIEFVERMPRTGTNKVSRVALKKPPYGVDVWDRRSQGVSIREVIERVRR